MFLRNLFHGRSSGRHCESTSWTVCQPESSQQQGDCQNAIQTACQSAWSRPPGPENHFNNNQLARNGRFEDPAQHMTQAARLRAERGPAAAESAYGQAIQSADNINQDQVTEARIGLLRQRNDLRRRTGDNTTPGSDAQYGRLMQEEQRLHGLYMSPAVARAGRGVSRISAGDIIRGERDVDDALRIRPELAFDHTFQNGLNRAYSSYFLNLAQSRPLDLNNGAPPRPGFNANIPTPNYFQMSGENRNRPAPFNPQNRPGLPAMPRPAGPEFLQPQRTTVPELLPMPRLVPPVIPPRSEVRPPTTPAGNRTQTPRLDGAPAANRSAEISRPIDESLAERLSNSAPGLLALGAAGWYLARRGSQWYMERRNQNAATTDTSARPTETPNSGNQLVPFERPTTRPTEPAPLRTPPPAEPIPLRITGPRGPESSQGQTPVTQRPELAAQPGTPGTDTRPANPPSLRTPPADALSLQFAPTAVGLEGGALSARPGSSMAALEQTAMGPRMPFTDRQSEERMQTLEAELDAIRNDPSQAQRAQDLDRVIKDLRGANGPQAQAEAHRAMNTAIERIQQATGSLERVGGTNGGAESRTEIEARARRGGRPGAGTALGIGLLVSAALAADLALQRRTQPAFQHAPVTGH